MAAKSKGQETKPTSRQVKLGLQAGPNTSTAYANYVEIAHTQHDFTLSFVRMPAKLPKDVHEAAVTTGRLLLTTEQEVVLPATVIGPLISALTLQLAAFEREAGEIDGKSSDPSK